MQRKCISAVLWKNPIKQPPNIHHMYSACSIGPSHIEDHPTGFSQTSPSGSISPCFTTEPLPSVASPYFFHCSPPSPLQRLYRISIGPDKPPHTLFFCFKKNLLFGDSPISPPCWNTPKGTGSSNRPWYPSFKGIRASMDLFIKNFFFWWSLCFSAFKSPNKNPPKEAHAVSPTPSLLPCPKTSQGETSTQSLVIS